MLLGGVVRAVGPDRGVQKAGILRQCVGMVVTNTMSSQRARVLRKRRVMIVVKGCGLHPKDLSEVYKIRQSRWTYLHSRSAPTENVATAAANECVGSAKGDEVDKLVVVEIKKFVWQKLRSQHGGKVLWPT